jgi:hypothetical protein
MSFKFWALGAAAAIGLSTAASAAPLPPVTGEVGFRIVSVVEGGDVTSFTPDLGSPSSLFAVSGFVTPSGAFAGLTATPFTSFAPFTVDPASLDLSGLSFVTELGSFTAGFIVNNGGPIWLGEGIFTPSASGALSGFGPTKLDFFLISVFITPCRDAVGGDDAVCVLQNGALSDENLVDPPTGVPAPAGLALFGLGLLGLAALRRRA